MKLSLAFVLFFFILEAKAFTEVECRGQAGQQEVRFEVERPFPANSFFKDAILVLAENGSSQLFRFQVTTHLTPGFNRVNYRDYRIELEVDFWPDQRPQWGRSYRGSLRSDLLDNRIARNLRCSFR